MKKSSNQLAISNKQLFLNIYSRLRKQYAISNKQLFFNIHSSKNNYCPLQIARCRLPIANCPLQIALLCLLLIAYCPFSFAQTPITLQAAIDTALKNNLSLRSENLNAEYLQKITGTAWTIPQTNVSFGYGQINSNYADNQVIVSQNIKFPTVYTRQKELFEEEWKSGMLNVSVREAELKKRVTHVYYELVFLQQKQKLLQHSDSIYAAFVEKAELRFEKGESNILEKTTAETQRGQITQQLKQLQQDIAIAQLQLKVLLNTATDFIPSQENVKMQLVSLPDTSFLYNYAYIKFLQQQRQVSEARLKLEKSKLSPDLFASYNNMTMRGNGADNKYYSGSTRFQSAQVGIGIPLFSGAQKNVIRAMTINKELARNNYIAGLQIVQSQYLQAVQQYNRYLQTVNYYETTANKNAETIIQTANLQFLNGDINYLEWVLLTNQAIAIQSEYIDAVRNLNTSTIEINSYINQ